MVFSLNQFTYVNGTTTYDYAANRAIPEVVLGDAPVDCDFSRTGMLFAENAFRFYCFKSGTTDTIYQFVWDGSRYTLGAKGSYKELKLTGLPADTNMQFFAMLYDGSDYRIYFAKKNAAAVYQAAWDGSSYAYGYNSVKCLSLDGFPADADFNRFAMLHDGTYYRYYALSKSDECKMYQGAWVSGSSSYKFGYSSIPEMQITGAPDNCAFNDFNMLYSGNMFHLYFPIAKKNQNQFAYTTSNKYTFAANGSIPTVKSSGFPADTDYCRSAMVHDGSDYRLYFMKAGTCDTIYQGAWNGSSYAYGHNSIKEIKITGMPGDADGSNFAMLHDGTEYRLYMRCAGVSMVYQFVWDGSSYSYGAKGSYPSIKVAGFPSDADLSRFTMMHDGSAYRYYAMSKSVATKVYQGSFNRSSESYAYKHNSIPELAIDMAPADADFSDISMLHDGGAYRLYLPCA